VALAASICVVLIGSALYFYLQQGVYSTGIGEQRALRLDDGSVVTLDAKSRVRVAYTDGARLLMLERGRARFDVARDPLRPFRVQAGDQTVVAHGTQFNVERMGETVLVTLLEGRVAVTGIAVASSAPTLPAAAAEKTSAPPPRQRNSAASVVELTAGQGLTVRANGRATMVPKIDVERATAWQSGRLFFDNEPLASAAERVNRYSKLQIEVSPSVANLEVSGVFTAGDADAFVEAISTYFPVRSERTGSAEIQLTAATE
jgi:transmembrane sensor